MKKRTLFSVVAAVVAMSPQFARAVLPTPDEMAEARRWGSMKTERVLFLGNSVTLHGPYIRLVAGRRLWSYA